MGSGFSLVEIEACPSSHYFLLVLQIFTDDIVKVQKSGLSVNERDHYHAVVVLQLCMLVKSVERDPRVCILLQLDDYTHTVSVRLVSYSRDAVDPLVLYKLTYLLKKSCLVHLERYLADYYLRASSVCLFYVSNSSYRDLALSCPVSLSCAFFSEYLSSRREVRSLYDLHEIVYSTIFIIYHLHGSIDDFAEIVRRYGCSHTYGDTVASVYEKVRES